MNPSRRSWWRKAGRKILVLSALTVVFSTPAGANLPDLRSATPPALPSTSLVLDSYL